MMTIWVTPCRVVQCTAYTTVRGGLGIPHLPPQVVPILCGFIFQAQEGYRSLICLLTLSATHE